MRHAEIFDRIYENNLWGIGSGPGSTPANTESYRSFLYNFIKTNQIESVVDVGCGDWQIGRLMDWSKVSYTGIDVSAIVLKNTKLYARPGVEFIEADAISDVLPSAELLLVKDVMQHWSNSDISAFLPKLKGFKRALITNGFHPALSDKTNADINTGGYRPVNLALDPFHLRGNYIYWYNGDEPKWIFLWQNFD